MGLITKRITSLVSLKQLWLPAMLGMIAGACNNNSATTTVTPSQPNKFDAAMILVGRRNDSGWNQAHYEATQYVVEKQPNIQFKYVEQVNPGDRPNLI